MCDEFSKWPQKKLNSHKRGQGYISLQGYFWLILGLLWAITLKFGTKTPFGKLWKDFGSDLWNLVSNPTYRTPQKEPKMPKIAKISFLSYSLQIRTGSDCLCVMTRSQLIFAKINPPWCQGAPESSQNECRKSRKIAKIFVVGTRLFRLGAGADFSEWWKILWRILSFFDKPTTRGCLLVDKIALKLKKSL